MKEVRILLGAALLFLLSVNVYAQDPGARDTVSIEGGPLFVGRSVPLRFRISNDENIGAFVNGMVVSSVDSGMMRLDSVVWVNRMADPTVLVFRANVGLRVDGSNPDSLMFGGLVLGPGSNDLPPGNSDLALAYFTGLNAGKVRIDSAFLDGASNFQLSATCCGAFTPEFVGGTFDIIIDDEPPFILSSYRPRHGVVGAPMELALEIVSSGLGGLTVSSSSISLVDDSQVSASAMSTTSITETVDMLWTPSFSDVGVWQYSVVVCDSTGSCDTATAEFDIVFSEDDLVGFVVKEFDMGFRWTGLLHGDLDDDGLPEIVATGSGIDDTPRLGVFKYDALVGLEVNQLEKDGFHNVAPVIGFLGSDSDLDLVTFGPRKDSRGIELAVRIFEGSRDAWLSLRDESLSYPTLPVDAKLADLTGDGKLDIVAASGVVVSILRPNSSGLLSSSSQFAVPDTVKSVNVADFDRDGDADLAIGAVSSLLLYLNDGFGNFTAGSVYPQSFSAVDIEVTNRSGDFNEDGILDLCVSTPSVGGTASELIIYTGDGVGGFTSEIVRTINGQVIGNSVGDFNGDTHLDVAYINASKREVGLLLGDGRGGFENELRYPVTHFPPRRIDCMDIDRDGDLDITVGSSQISKGGSIYVLENTLNPSNVSRVGLTIAGMDNVALSLRAPDGGMLSSVRNALPGSEYYLRDVNDDGLIDEYLDMRVAQSGGYTVSAMPKSAYSDSASFTLELNVEGVKRRLAKDMPMCSNGFSFKIYPDGESPHFPVNGAFVPDAVPSFTVTTTGGFDFEIAEDCSFSAPLNSASVDGDFYPLPISLAGSDTTLYYWRYRTKGSESWSGPIALNVLATASPLCGDVDGSRSVNVADIVYGISKMFASGAPPIDRAGGDVNKSGSFDISDTIYMISYVFARGPAPVCP